MKKSTTVRPENFINKFIDDSKNKENGRYQSWNKCFEYFSKLKNKKLTDKELDYASLLLAFYLASWGMLRGSSFLLNYTYTIHINAIKIMFKDKYKNLWRTSKIDNFDKNKINLIFNLKQELNEYYTKFNNYKNISNILISKILLGVFGCIPAYDEYVKKGLKALGLQQKMSADGFKKIIEYFKKNRFKKTIKYKKYPIMKLIDMYLWILGLETSTKKD